MPAETRDARAEAELHEEARRYQLRYACEDCVYFVPETRGCVHGYPNASHLRGSSLPRLSSAPSLPIVFCKEYELA